MGFALLFSALKGLFLLCIGIFGIGFLIAIHELGHFLFCKFFDISTPSFSIGFGPKLWSKKIGETEFSLSALPIGGYVEIAGLYEPGQGEQQEAVRDDHRSFNKKPLWQKFFVIGGGIIVNMLFCYLTLIALFSIGIPATPLLYPENATTLIKTVEPNGPAAKAGILPGDFIYGSQEGIGEYLSQNAGTKGNELRVDNNPGNLSAIITEHINKPVHLSIIRKRAQAVPQKHATPEPTASFEHGTGFIPTLGVDPLTGALISADTHEKIYLTVTPVQHPQQKTRGMLGVTFAFKATQPLPFLGAIKEGIKLTHRFFLSVFSAFSNMITKRSTDGMGGPLMIISATVESANQGLALFLLLLAFISVNLAALNLIPLPILDGGQILIILVEALLRRQLPEKTKAIVFYMCWALLMLLMLWLSIKDIYSFSKWFFGSH